MTGLSPSPLSSGDELSVAAACTAIAAAVARHLAAPVAPVAHPQALDAGAAGPARGKPAVEGVPLAAALGRVLAADVLSPIHVPAHDNSAMDGFAFDANQLPVPGEATAGKLVLPVVGTVRAGASVPAAVAAGSCVRIMTGAVMPLGANTVLPHELCRPVQRAGMACIEFAPQAVQPGDNRRLQGEDLRQGQLALAAGHVLRSADVGLLASLGLAEVPVRPQLRVALFSTGDELCEPGQPLPAGHIYDSNRASLRAALQALGLQVVDLGLVRDDPQALAQTLRRAVQEADAIVTSGGVSMGDADHTRAVLQSLGSVAFWKVAMRPGRPFAFGPVHADDDAAQVQAQAQAQTPSQSGGIDGHRGHTHTPRRSVLMFALPGNPVAALVTFHVFVRDALRTLAGATPRVPLRLQARAQMAIRKRPGRSEYQRGVLSRAADGSWQVRLTGTQGAGVLSSMSQADGLILLGHDQGSVAVGDWVEVMPLADDGL